MHSTSAMFNNDYSGCRATIMGLGTFGGGVAAARFLADRGANVSITDLRSAAELQDSLARLQDIPIRNLWLGQHPPEAFENCDLLVVSPAVKPGNPLVEQCRQRQVAITSEIELFLKHNPAAVVAVTGSNGKSTTTALVHHLLQPTCSQQDRTVWLGGNIGHSLLTDVDRIRSEDVVVLELSSFQLQQLSQTSFAARVAIVTNFTPNHLEWHDSLQAYRNAKQILLRGQTAGDTAVLPDELLPEDGWRTRGRLLRFGISDTGEDGVFLEDGLLILRCGDFEDAIRLQQPPRLPGQHNRLNLAAAACATWQLGVDPATISDRLQSFSPLPHRLQQVASGRGLRFFNDSIATTPESAVAAIQVCGPGCVLLAGGYDKGIDLTQLAKAASQSTRAVVLMGKTAAQLEHLIRDHSASDGGPQLRHSTDFPDAFAQAVELAVAGDIVLLSPGCASYGWFRDYRDRGDQFIQLARQWAASP